MTATSTVFPFCCALLHPSIIYFSKIDLLQTVLSEWVLWYFVYRMDLCKYALLRSAAWSPYPSLISACAIINTQADCPVQRWIVYWCHSPSSGSHRLLHNEGITYDVFLFFFNQCEDPDSWLPTLFGNLSLSFEIRRRVLLGSKGIRSRAHWLSLKILAALKTLVRRQLTHCTHFFVSFKMRGMICSNLVFLHLMFDSRH